MTPENNEEESWKKIQLLQGLPDFGPDSGSAHATGFFVVLVERLGTTNLVTRFEGEELHLEECYMYQGSCPRGCGAVRVRYPRSSQLLVELANTKTRIGHMR